MTRERSIAQTRAPAAKPAGGSLADLLRQHENLIKYGGIGATAVAIDLGVFVVMHEIFDFAPWLAHSVSVGLAVVWSFLLNAFFNFRTTDRLATRFLSFATVSFVGYLVGLVVIWLVVDGFDLGGTLAKVISMPLVFVTQYVLNTRYSFRAEL